MELFRYDFLVSLKKSLLIFSIGINFCLATGLVISLQSNSLNFRETKRIDQLRLRDLKLLEMLLIGRMSKDEVLTALKANFPQDSFFEKPEENGVGLGSMFLEFDITGKLQKMNSPPQEGP